MSDRDQICGKPADSKMLWPGRDPMPVCPDHHARAIQIAGAMGFYLPSIQVEPGDRCTQHCSAAQAKRKDGE